MSAPCLVCDSPPVQPCVRCKSTLGHIHLQVWKRDGTVEAEAVLCSDCVKRTRSPSGESLSDYLDDADYTPKPRHWNPGGRKPIGHRTVAVDGYVNVKVPDDHPMAPDSAMPNGSWVHEHRLVMAEHIGRPLTRNEHVHHINGDRGDNRIENLELWTKAHPNGVRVQELHCDGCTCEGQP